MAFKFLNKERILSAQLFGQAFKYLVEKYEQSKNILTPASPFSQILHVVSEIGELIFYYIENVSSELNIKKARNRDSVYGLSTLTGHNPFRGSSAVGKLKIRFKNGADKEVNGDFFNIPKYTKVSCLNNSLQYFLFFDSNNIKIVTGSTDFYYVQLIQGIVESQTFKATGYDFESFSLLTKDYTDHFNVSVSVNDDKYTEFDSIYDMQPDEKGYVLKTGFNGGLSVFFGNGNFGSILPQGARVKITYVKTGGTNGNIGAIDEIMLHYDDPGYTLLGEEVDLNKTLTTIVEIPPSIGSDAEPIYFTRAIAPKTSKSYVLANPENYVYYLRRYNYFSYINAYNTFGDEYLDDDNIIYLFLLPDVTKKLTSEKDYFTINTSEFTLTTNEKDAILKVIEESGQQLISTEVKFVDPVINKYVLNIVLRVFDNINEHNIREDIRSSLSEYFLSVRRRDKIPKSDIVALIEKIEGIDSVNVSFISEANENAIRNGFYIVPIYGTDSNTGLKVKIEDRKIILENNQNPLLGLDEFGDISIRENELPLIRGGWLDRNSNTYLEYPDNNKLSSLNIIFKETIKKDIFNQINDNNRKQLI